MNIVDINDLKKIDAPAWKDWDGSEEEIFARCVRAEVRRSVREGLTYDQPSFTASTFDEPGVFVLRNNYREIARYGLTRNGVRRVEVTSA